MDNGTQMDVNARDFKAFAAGMEAARPNFGKNNGNVNPLADMQISVGQPQLDSLRMLADGMDRYRQDLQQRATALDEGCRFVSVTAVDHLSLIQSTDQQRADDTDKVVAINKMFNEAPKLQGAIEIERRFADPAGGLHPPPTTHP